MRHAESQLPRVCARGQRGYLPISPDVSVSPQRRLSAHVNEDLAYRVVFDSRVRVGGPFQREPVQR